MVEVEIYYEGLEVTTLDLPTETEVGDPIEVEGVPAIVDRIESLSGGGSDYRIHVLWV